MSATRCFDLNAFYVAGAALALASDVIILMLPMPVVWRLQVSKNQKIGLSVVFLLGGL